MKFKYRKLNLKDPFSRKNYILRPIIPVSLKGKNKSVHYEALIDTGADFCIFPLGLAKTLDIDLTKNSSLRFAGINGEPMEGFMGDIKIGLGKEYVFTKIVFAQTTNVVGILGQRGFFDHFDVKLSYQKQVIEIEPDKISN